MFWHMFVASCVPNGFIYHYLLKETPDAGASGNVQMPELLEKVPCDRPMYLNVDGKVLQVVLRQPFSENRQSGLVCFPIRSDGLLGPASEIISTGGEVACHVCGFREKIYVANYISGSVFCSDGSLKAHTGRGLHEKRQDAPHVHFVAPSPDNAYLFAVDLGLDSIFVYDEHLNMISKALVPPGCGCRHLAYAADGRTVFCVNELDSSVTVFSYCEGKLEEKETVAVLSKRNPSNTSAAIRVQDSYVFVSNRGDDSVSSLYWDGDHLSLCSVTPCGGCSPRDIFPVGSLLFCANENSDNVTIFDVDGPALHLREEQLKMDCPLCVSACPDSL